MAKRNKLKKKRLKRHLQRRMQQTKLVKEVAVPAPEEITPTALYQQALFELYEGKVKAKNRYVSSKAVLKHKCIKCNENFYARPMYMLGKKQHRHLCHFPCSDRYGVRHSQVSGGRDNQKKRKKKDKSEDVAKQFNEMIWEGYSHQQIATKLKVNPNIIKEYFEAEGLI